MSEQPKALFLADELEAPLGTVISSEVDRRAAIELRRLHAENERLTKLCYDYIGELTAMRAAKQMQARIDKMKGAVAPVGLPAGESAAVATAPARRLTDDEIGQIWFAAKIPGLTESDARRLIRDAEEAR